MLSQIFVVTPLAWRFDPAMRQLAAGYFDPLRTNPKLTPGAKSGLRFLKSVDATPTIGGMSACATALCDHRFLEDKL